MKADSGSIVYAGQTVGHLRQETEEVGAAATVLSEAMTAFQEVLNLESEEQRLIQEMDEHPDHDTDSYRRLMTSFDTVHQKLLAADIHLIQAAHRKPCSAALASRPRTLSANYPPSQVAGE